MASANDYFKQLGDPGSATTLAAPGHTIGGTSFNVDSTGLWPTSTGVTFSIDTTVDNVRVPGTYTVWDGVVTSPTQITGAVLRYGTDQNYPAGATTRVYILPQTTYYNRVMTGLTLNVFDQDATMKAGAVDNAAAVADGILTQAKFANGQYVGIDGYIGTTDTWTYASATTFTIAGVDRTAMFPVGTKIKLTQTTAKYFYVTAASFSTNTTVTITGGSDYTLANAAITSPFYSYDASPQGFPGEFAFTPTYTNLTVGAGTNTGYFSMAGKRVKYRGYWKFGSGAAVGTNAIATLPVAAASTYNVVTAIHPIGNVRYLDSGTANYLGLAAISGTSGLTAFQFLTSALGGSYTTTGGLAVGVPMTWATDDEINWSVEYTAA